MLDLGAVQFVWIVTKFNAATRINEMIYLEKVTVIRKHTIATNKHFKMLVISSCVKEDKLQE